MAWLREAGIRKLGEYLGKDVDWLFPNILSNYVETRKRAWMSCYDGDRVSPVKKRPVIDDDEDDEEEEERCGESSDDDEDLDYVDEDYTEKSPRRTSARQRKVSFEAVSSKPSPTETPPKRSSPTPPQSEAPRKIHFKYEEPLTASQPRKSRELTTNLDGANPLAPCLRIRFPVTQLPSLSRTTGVAT